MQTGSLSHFGTQLRDPELIYPAITTVHLPISFGTQPDYGTQLHMIPLQPNVSTTEQRFIQLTTNFQPHSINNLPQCHSSGFDRPVNGNSTPSANSEALFLNRWAVNSYPAYQPITFVKSPSAFNSDLLIPTEPFVTCSYSDASNFQGTINQTSTQPISFHQPDGSASINQQQILQSFITQQPPLATHQQLLGYNHQPAIGIHPTNQFLSRAMNTFGCQPQSLQPPITQQTTSCQPTQQYTQNLTTRHFSTVRHPASTTYRNTCNFPTARRLLPT